MRGSGSTARASTYGTTSRTARTSSRPPPPRASPSNVINVDAINDNDSAKPPATSTSARRSWSVASAPTRPSQPLDPFQAPNYSLSAYAGSAKGKGGLSSKGGRGRCVLSGGICRNVQNSTEWASCHIRRHNRLGSARASPGLLACSGIDQGRVPPPPHARETLQAVWAPAPDRCRILSRTVLESRKV